MRAMPERASPWWRTKSKLGEPDGQSHRGDRGQDQHRAERDFDAVKAINSIAQVITEMSSISSTVASAVQQQTAATSEIARNVEQAAIGTREVSSNIVQVETAARETGIAANQTSNWPVKCPVRPMCCNGR